VGALQDAFKKWTDSAVHVVSIVEGGSEIEYLFNGKRVAGQGFCQGRVETILASNFSVRELLEGLYDVLGRLPIIKRKSRGSWWSRQKAQLRL
jgi:hypothetical protein